MNDFNFYGLGNFISTYDFKDKNKNVESYIVYMLNRLMSMFEYKNLPDTIPQHILELYLLVNGHSVVIEKNDLLYVCFGGFGGEPNEYYMPTKYIVANPYLELFETYTIDVDCVLLKNDTLMYGVIPMFKRYASALVENDITMNMVDINSRIVALIDAADDPTRVSAEKFLSDIVNGNNGVIASNAFLNGIRAQPYGEHNHQRLTDLIEYQQYIKASWFNELGLNANYNMKREAINSNESQLNDDMLLPLIDDMMNCRKEQINKINEMFGTNISIDWGSSWKDNVQELEALQEMENTEVDRFSTDSNISSDNMVNDNTNNINSEETTSDDNICPSNDDSSVNDIDVNVDLVIGGDYGESINENSVPTDD